MGERLLPGVPGLQRLRRQTVQGLCDQYLKGLVECNPKEKRAAEVRRRFDKMLEDFRALDAAKMTRDQASNLLESHIDTPVVAAKLRAELGAALDCAHDAGRLDESVPN